jgi:hypothetical protein
MTEMAIPVRDSDDIKEVMAQKGMVPEVEGLSPMEAATLIHEESGLIANLLAKRLYREKKNIVWDITMSRRGSVEKRLGERFGLCLVGQPGGVRPAALAV